MTLDIDEDLKFYLYITKIKSRVNGFFEKYSELKKENAKLENQVEELKIQNKKLIEEIEKEKKNNEYLKIANAISKNAENSRETKKYINNIIKKIDSCIENLNNT